MRTPEEGKGNPELTPKKKQTETFFVIQKENSVSHPRPIKAYLKPQVIEEAIHFITVEELENLREWIEDDREQGDVWTVGFRYQPPRFQVEALGEIELKQMIPLAAPGEYLAGSKGILRTYNRYFLGHEIE